MKNDYIGENYLIDGVNHILTCEMLSDGGGSTPTAWIFERMPNNDWNIVDSKHGPTRSACILWLGKKLDAVQRKRLYLETGHSNQCVQKSAVSKSRSVAAKQYVAAYLTIHLNLTSQLNSSGTQGWDLTTFKSGCNRGCSIKVKYRESGNSVQIGANVKFDFLVCVVPGDPLRIDSSNLHGSSRYRDQMECYVIPASHISGAQNFDFRFTNYEENWKDIREFFMISP